MSKYHDEIVQAILIPVGKRKGDIRLIGRVQDSRLRHSAENEAFILLGDLHLLSPERQREFGARMFSYGEEPCLLAEILESLAKLKKAWRNEGAALRTFQLGDFFDIWREFPGEVDLTQLGDDVFGRLRDVLYRGRARGRNCLKAFFLLGNHDCRGKDRFSEVGFWVKAFNLCSRDVKPFLMALHGDVFDWIEKFPTFMKSLMVNLAGKSTPESCYPIGIDNTTANAPAESMWDSITEPVHHLPVAGAPAVVPGKSLPRLFCQSASSIEAAAPLHKHFQRIHEMIGTARNEEAYGSGIRIVAMGHTHHARMVFLDPESEEPPLLLMDMGAWYEDCRYMLDGNGDEVREPSAQMGVIAGNDARLYQIHVPE